MKKINISQDMETLVDDDLFEVLSQYKWRLDQGKKQYVITTIKSKTIRMHRLIMGAKMGDFVDHIDGDALNNQRANLRFCELKQNQGNRKINKNSSTGFKGVIEVN